MISEIETMDIALPKLRNKQIETDYHEMFARALTNKYSKAFGYWCFIKFED